VARSKTLKCLKTALAGETLARCRYDIFADLAEREGHPEIAALLRDTALNEATHTGIHLELLKMLGTTLENLETAVAEEEREGTQMYPEFAQIAEAEGQADAADAFKKLAVVERNHAERLRKALECLKKKPNCK
jgi:rubrerythrin